MTQTITPRIENGRTMRIAGLSGHFGPTNRDQIPALWGRFGPAYFGRTPQQVDERCYGLCWNQDGKGGLDYLAGVEVTSFDGVPAELTRMTLEPQRYAVFPHTGLISAIGETWMAIYDRWLPQSGHTLVAAPSYECYDERFDPAVAGHVEIWIPI